MVSMHFHIKISYCFLLLTFILMGCSQPKAELTAPSTESLRQYFQLKIYSFQTRDQELATDRYLQDAYLPALKRQGLGPIGIFKPHPSETDTSLKTYIMIPYQSLEQVVDVEDAIMADVDHHRQGASYINTSHEEPMYDRIQVILMRAFVDMPQMKPSPLDGPREDRVYELRSYESASESIYRNKVDMFNAGGEVTLFEQIGSHAVFYGEVLSGSRMPNLIYMTTYAHHESRDEHWKTFVESPEWQRLKADPKYQNNVSHIDINLLYPTDYSEY